MLKPEAGIAAERDYQISLTESQARTTRLHSSIMVYQE
jgi:hypothetical protein